VGAAALLVAAGCGDDGGADRIDNAAEFCADLVDAWAAKTAECYGATLDAARAEVEYMVPCDRIEEAAAAGHVGFDQAVAESCVAAMDALTCWEAEMQGGPPPECADAVPAQVASGGACFTDTPIECIGGYCEFDACNAPGTCTTYALETEPCGVDPDYRRCAQDLYCDGATSTCMVGGPPVISGLDEPCGSGQICAEALYCAWTGMEYLCRAQGTGTCDASDACVQGYRCIYGTCTTIKAVGQPCTTGMDSTGECIYGAYCRAPTGSPPGTGGVCTAWPRTGGECGYLPYKETADCIDSWCEVATVGMALSPAARPALVSPLAIMGVGTCQPYLGLGEWCGDASWDACGPAAFCNYGSCAKAYCIAR
jgi:hypothetical protein